eukprot:NODE_478_length_7890_cov_0.158388.p7 type:complete len:110 gc:universal NODE_478_length_7890_cov_0.158388:7064-7393(+)
MISRWSSFTVTFKLGKELGLLRGSCQFCFDRFTSYRMHRFMTTGNRRSLYFLHFVLQLFPFVCFELGFLINCCINRRNYPFFRFHHVYFDCYLLQWRNILYGFTSHRFR